MSTEFFSVVTTDGREHLSVDALTLQKWHAEKLILDETPVFSAAIGEFRPLNRIFDLKQWANAGAPNVSVSNAQPPVMRSSAQPPPAYVDDRAQLPGSNGPRAYRGDQPYRADASTADARRYNPQTSHQPSPFQPKAQPDAAPQAAGNNAPANPVKTAQVKAAPPMKNARSGPQKAKSSFLGALAALVVIGGIIGGGAYYYVNFMNPPVEKAADAKQDIVASVRKDMNGDNSYTDKESGLRMALPPEWGVVAASNTYLGAQFSGAKMFAAAPEKQLFAALDIKPLKEKADLKSLMSEQTMSHRQKGGGAITLLSEKDGKIGANASRASIFMRKDSVLGDNVTFHTTVFADKKNIYVLNVWCPTADYAELGEEFGKIESSISFQ